MPENKLQVTTTQIQQELERAQVEALLKYYTIDNSNPFNPRYVPRPDVEIVVPEGEIAHLGFGLDLANAITRANRRRAYERLRKLKPKLRPIVSVGDSWFLHPLIPDTINHLIEGHGFAIYSADEAGAEINNYMNENDWKDALKRENAQALLISGGGNDVLGKISNHLNQHTPGPAGKNPQRFLNAGFTSALQQLSVTYQQILQYVITNHPGVKIFVHSYDYVIPRSGSAGKWLGGPLRKAGINEPADHRALIQFVINEFTKMLEALPPLFQNSVFYVSRRVRVGDLQWYDEIHPTGDGYSVVAGNFREALEGAGVFPI